MFFFSFLEQDKWRNVLAFPGGYGSRQRVMPGKSKKLIIHKPVKVSTPPKEQNDMEICVPDPPTTLARPLQSGSSKRPIPMPLPRSYQQIRRCILPFCFCNYVTCIVFICSISCYLRLLAICGIRSITNKWRNHLLAS